MKPEFYYIMSFKTTTDAMQSEKYAKDRIRTAIMPVPREISSGCGLALRFIEENEKTVTAFFESTPVNGTLYKMYTKKINGRYPVEQIAIS